MPSLSPLPHQHATAAVVLQVVVVDAEADDAALAGVDGRRLVVAVLGFLVLESSGRKVGDSSFVRMRRRRRLVGSASLVLGLEVELVVPEVEVVGRRRRRGWREGPGERVVVEAGGSLPEHVCVQGDRLPRFRS